VAVREGLTGVVCGIQNLKQGPLHWTFKAIPIVQLMHMEARGGKQKPVIAKALVDIKGEPFLYFARVRKQWEMEDQYLFPGPIQFFGPPEVTDSTPLTL
jgi:pyrophosphate--fructose-6-phosphate 1-phosphotransferase